MTDDMLSNILQGKKLSEYTVDEMNSLSDKLVSSSFAIDEKLYFTTDWHLQHRKLVEIGERPEGFEELIRDSMFSQTRPGDVVIHLGDIYLGRTSQMVETVRSFIPEGVRFVNIQGNHDNYSPKKFLDCGISNVQSLTLDGILYTHQGRATLSEGVWTQVFGHYHLSPKPESFKGLRLSLEEENYRLVTYHELAIRLVKQNLDESTEAMTKWTNSQK